MYSSFRSILSYLLQSHPDNGLQALFYLRGYELYLADAPNRTGLPPCLGGYDPAERDDDCIVLP